MPRLLRHLVILGIVAGHNVAVYSSAEAAVRHLSKSVALYCARKVTISAATRCIRCSSPTPILDPPVGRCGRDEAYAKLGRQALLGHIGEADGIAYAVLESRQ